ncbi:MAG: PKD domain-containing protein [Saprospiraceae bacterium]
MANLLTVEFCSSSSGATSYSWDFGDNTTSADADPSHTYAADGTYEVTLTATNACGSETSTQTVVVATAQQLVSQPMKPLVVPLW